MRKNRMYPLVALVANFVLFSVMAAYAFETFETEEESDVIESIMIDETEADSFGLEPKAISGDESFRDQYPAIEAQVEEQLNTLSDISSDDLDYMIESRNREINYSVKEVAESMRDTSSLTIYDDATMATVKMLRNWRAVKDSCGVFDSVTEYVADMTGDVLTLYLSARYENAEINNTAVNIKFTYDLVQGASLMDWEMREGLFDTKVWKGSDIPGDEDIWARLEALEEKLAQLDIQDTGR